MKKGRNGMTKQEKLKNLEEIMDLEEGVLKEDDVLAEYEEWDSVSILSFIALMDEMFEKEITGADIKEFIRVKDVLEVMVE